MQETPTRQDRSNPPRLSVLIPSFNQDRYLVKTLATVAKQDYRPLEVCIADGGSTDRTRDVVEAYGDLITRFVSAPDRGQLDGVEKAINMATGDILYWLNADDAVMPGAFQSVARAFMADPALEIVYSDSYAFEETTRALFVSDRVSNLGFWDHFLFYRQMPSEAIYWRREITSQAFPLDHKLRVYTDYSFFLPLRYGRKHRWLPRRLGAFRMQPTQNSQKFRPLGDQERELIKQRMRERLGMTLEEFERRQKQHRLKFLLTQRFYPKAVSATRYALRKLTGDIARKRMAHFLFDDWLQVPAHVREKLGDELCDAAAGGRRPVLHK